MSDANKAVVRRWFKGQESPDSDRISEVLDKNYVWHGPGDLTVEGSNGIQEMLRSYLLAFPDLRFTIEDQMADGDKVITRWTANGTQSGPFEGMAATGKSVTVTGIAISRVDNGKVTEDWESFDELGMMRQVGAVQAAG